MVSRILIHGSRRLRMALVIGLAAVSLVFLWPPSARKASAVEVPAKGESLDQPFKSRENLPNGYVIMRSEEGLVSPWTASPDLSRACRKGLFKQRRQHRYRAVLKGRIYGAAVGGHASLVDKVGLAQPQVIYVFISEGSTNCRVYHRGT